MRAHAPHPNPNLNPTPLHATRQVGIFDADVYGPSLPTMVSPELRILRMDPQTRSITPTEYEGVQLVSFGFAGQGSAIMRGAMVSGLIQQMLTTTEWGAFWGVGGFGVGGLRAFLGLGPGSNVRASAACCLQLQSLSNTADPHTHLPPPNPQKPSPKKVIWTT